MIEKSGNKLKRGRGWPILKKEKEAKIFFRNNM